MNKKKTTRILLLDDDAEFCEALAELLEDAADVHFVTSPEVFFSTIDKFHPQLVIIDFNLKHKSLSGLDVIRRIKKRPDSHLISIIMLSGADDAGVIQTAYKSGVDDYVMKPVMPQIFLAKVENVIFQSKKKIHTQALTGLPGIALIEEEYYRRSQENKIFSVAYSDLDNFKPFNDEKGVKKGDEAIQVISGILMNIRYDFTKRQLFIGHLGGDDFFLLGNRASVSKAVLKLNHEFELQIHNFFTYRENQDNFYRGKSRDGDEKKFPLLSVSTAILDIHSSNKINFEKLSHEAAKLKKKAKLVQGNSVVKKQLADYSLPKRDVDLFREPNRTVLQNDLMKPSKKSRY